MNAKNRFGRIMFTCAAILFVLACNLPGGQKPAPPATQVANIVATTQPAPVSLPTKTLIKTSTPTLTLKPTSTFTLKPTATITSTLHPTITPLPDFDPVVNFGGGGGYSSCSYPKAPNAVFVQDVRFGRIVDLCFTLLRMDFNRPFQLEFIGPDGRIFQSPDLFLDQNNNGVLWPQGNYGSVDWTSDGTFFLAISLRWPLTLPIGKWTVRADGDRFGVEGNFMVVKNGVHPYINALDPRSEYEITPSGTFHLYDPVRMKDNGNLTVVGIDYPANSTVFVLLNRERPSQVYDHEFELIQKQVVTSDSNGNIKTEFSGPLEPGHYLVYGIIDPYTRISNGGMGCADGVPCDFFVVISSISGNTSATTSSCPGAPAQRMTVNQRGYVCTKEDAVKLRTAPSRSGSEITKLAPGASFKVIDGPSCADNWSWWKISTDSGYEGWISEGGDTVDPYFICPLK